MPADRIQVLTFTRRSAKEIVERVKVGLEDRAEGLNASTFHTWCMILIRRLPKCPERRAKWRIRFLVTSKNPVVPAKADIKFYKQMILLANLGHGLRRGDNVEVLEIPLASDIFTPKPLP